MEGEGGSVGSELPGSDMLGVRYTSCWEELGDMRGGDEFIPDSSAARRSASTSRGVSPEGGPR